jgi:hypothetical protein
MIRRSTSIQVCDCDVRKGCHTKEQRLQALSNTIFLFVAFVSRIAVVIGDYGLGDGSGQSYVCIIHETDATSPVMEASRHTLNAGQIYRQEQEVAKSYG